MSLNTKDVCRALGIATVCLGLIAGCSKKQAASTSSGSTGGVAEETGSSSADMKLCNFSAGPSDAKVVVKAFYPGRHPASLGAVKDLLKKFPNEVRIEIVDWRTAAGMKKRDEAGLTCAGVVINGKNAFDIKTKDGKTDKVLFVREIDGEWTESDLDAAVTQELAAAKK